jgi:hypothetical protein
MDGVGQILTGSAELMAGSRFHEVGHTCLVESPERDPSDTIDSSQIGQRSTEGMHAVDVGVAVGADHCQAR